MSNALVLDGFWVEFPYEVDSLQSKVDELMIISKLLGVNAVFYGPSRLSKDELFIALSFYHGTPERSYIDISFSVVDKKNMVNEVTVYVNPFIGSKKGIKGEFRYNGLDLSMIEERLKWITSII